MLNFMLDPTGDAPWEEDPAAKNVVQVNSEKVNNNRKLLLLMFYCTFIVPFLHNDALKEIVNIRQ